MDWQHFIGLGIVAAVFTAGSNWFSTWYFSNRQQKQSADYDAVRLAIALERFAYECASLISDESTWYASQGSAGALFDEMPLLQFPAETVWKNLDSRLVDRVLTLDNHLVRANSVIRGEAEHLIGELATAEEPAGQAGLMGYRAHVLAKDLRSKYAAIHEPEKLHPWDYISVLKEKHDVKMELYRSQVF